MKNNTQSEVFLKEIIDRLNALGIPDHGKGVKVAEITGYATSSVSEILSGKKNCTKRFHKATIDGLSQSESSAFHPDLPELTRIFVKIDDAGRATIMTVARLAYENSGLKQSGAMVGSELLKKCKEVEELKNDYPSDKGPKDTSPAARTRKRKPSGKDQPKDL